MLIRLVSLSSLLLSFCTSGDGAKKGGRVDEELHLDACARSSVPEGERRVGSHRDKHAREEGWRAREVDVSTAQAGRGRGGVSIRECREYSAFSVGGERLLEITQHVSPTFHFYEAT